jgi:hypothetical protein
MRNNLILAMAYVFLAIKLSFLSTISIAQPEGITRDPLVVTLKWRNSSLIKV